MSNRQPPESIVNESMRPNIRITHALNGRVKDYAAERDLSTSEAYERVIEAGLEQLKGETRDVTHARTHEEPEPEAEEANDLRARAEEVLDGLEVKGRKAPVEKNRRDAIMWAWDYLREHGSASSSEIANATFGAFFEENIRYTTSPRYPGYGMWDGVVRDVLKQLPGVVGPGERGHEWQFDESA